MISRRHLFVCLYAASGVAALVYEIVWTRLFALELGHTVAAASTVLAAFMGGLAAGAWLAGRLPSRSLRLYAALEVAVGLAALAIPVALSATTPLLAWAYAGGSAPARFAIVRVAVCMALLVFPTAAMGATFPIAADWYARQGSHRASPADVGVLYAANTAGAALGALAAGFWLIPALGLRAATLVGVTFNLIAAAGAFAIAQRPEVQHRQPAQQEQRRSTTRRSDRPTREPAAAAIWVATIAAGVSGCAALVYEVAWTRLLALVLGPTTYAFATMTAAFLTGMAMGSALGTRIARRSPDPIAWLAAMLIATGTSATAAAWVAATRLPLVIAALVASPAVSFGKVVTVEAAISAVLLLPAAFALGAAFPLALATAAGGTAITASKAAHVYVANTLGAIGGALAAGFVLIPAFGVRSTFQAAAVFGTIGAACLAAAMFGRRTGSRRPSSRGARALLAASLVTAVSIGLLPRWDHALLASGAYKYAPYLASSDFDAVLRAGSLEYYKEGAASTVTVRRLTGTLSLSIDGKIDATNAGDMLTQRLLGLLPTLLHGHAEEICVIGLGSGVTVASALAPGTVKQVDVVEISPEVVEASRFFESENDGVLARPDVRLIVGDGRSHLLLTRRRYDVIVSEPSNPWMAGVASLFTREFFEAARARLKPDGLLCQWAHTYDISGGDLRSIVRTFASVFPQATLWRVGGGDILLIGTAGRPIDARLDEVARLAQGSAPRVLASVGIAPHEAAFDLFSLFAAGTREIERFAGDAAIQTDDRMALEYSAPRAIYGASTGENAVAIRELKSDKPSLIRSIIAAATDKSWASKGSMELKAEAYAVAYDAFRGAVMLNGRNAEALAGLSDAASGAHLEREEREWLTSLTAREPSNAPARIELSRVTAAAGDFDAAVRTATEALQLVPEDPRAAEQLASVLADAGDANRLTPVADTLAVRFPGRPDAQYYRATALFLRGKAEEAIVVAQALVDAHPDHARAQNLLGAACATLGRVPCAQAAFDASIQAGPHDPSTYVNRGLLSLQAADARAAAASFAEALTLDPTLPAARDGLARARSQISGEAPAAAQKSP